MYVCMHKLGSTHVAIRLSVFLQGNDEVVITLIVRWNQTVSIYVLSQELESG